MSQTRQIMTNTIQSTKPERSAVAASFALAILLVAASLWQQWSWSNVTATAITCGQARFPAYTGWGIATTLVTVAISAVYYLRFAVRPGLPDRFSSLLIAVGLGVSVLVGVVMLLPILLVFTGPEGLGGPLPTLTQALDEFFVLGMYVGPPVAGIVGVVIARSQTTLMGDRRKRVRIAFAVAAGGSVLSFLAAYSAVALNCLGHGSVLQ